MPTLTAADVELVSNGGSLPKARICLWTLIRADTANRIGERVRTPELLGNKSKGAIWQPRKSKRSRSNLNPNPQKRNLYVNRVSLEWQTPNSNPCMKRPCPTQRSATRGRS